MAKRKIKSDDRQLMEPFDFEKSVKAGPGGVTKDTLTRAKAKAKEVDAKRVNKVLKSVRYEKNLLDEVQRLAERESLPYQTLMNILLKKGIAAMQSNLEQRVEKLEHEFAAQKEREEAG